MAKRAYSNYLGKGFYQDYTPQQRYNNLFFVFAQGDRETLSFDTQKLESIKKKTISSLSKAQKTCMSNEISFVNELCTQLRDSAGTGLDILDEYLAADPNYKDIQKIIKNGAHSVQDLYTFFNSRYFNQMSMALDTGGDHIDTSRGETVRYDAFWRKVWQDMCGLQTAASKAKTWGEAYSRLKAKWHSYGYNTKNNTWSVVGDYFGSFGKLFQQSGLEDDLLMALLGEISKSQKTANEVRALLTTNAGASFSTGKYKSGSQVIKHGAFNEILASIFASFYLPKIYGKTGNVTISAERTGNDKIAYSKWNYKTGQVESNGFNLGQTDLRLNFDFVKDSGVSSYQINVSEKMTMGDSRQKNKDSDVRKSYQTKVYEGGGDGGLKSALNRILSSSLFRTSGFMTTQDYKDLAYLLINAGEGGIGNEEEAIKAYRAVVGFVAMEDMSEVTSDSPSVLANLDSRLGAKVVNLFQINGKYIPASAYYRALYKYVNSGYDKAVRANIKFAKTFSESKSSDPSVYAPAYKQFIKENQLGETITKTNQNGSSSSFLKGDPQKVREFILKSTKPSNVELKWTDFWRNEFTGVFR